MISLNGCDWIISRMVIIKTPKNGGAVAPAIPVKLLDIYVNYFFQL
jgi:hypothetical protein